MSADEITYQPAPGWYFTHPATPPDRARVFYRVALWRISQSGEVVGMIAVNVPSSSISAPARLHTPPVVSGGVYVHVDDLTAEDRALIASGRFA